MACNCGKKSGTTTLYVVTSSSGTKTYKTETEAIAAAARTGGTYKAVTS